MKSDGTIWVDTKIDESGMEEGFRRMQDGAEDVAVTVKKLGSVLENAYAAAGDSKAVTKACDKLQELKNAYAAVSDQLNSEKRKLATLKEDYAWLSEQLNPYGDTSKTGFNLDLDTFLEYQEALKALPDQIDKQTALVEQLEKKWTKSSEAINNAVTRVTATVNAELEKQNAAMQKAAADQATAVEQLASRSAAASAETQEIKRAGIYDRISRARKKLAKDVAASARAEATAEENSTQRVIAAEEREAAAKERTIRKLAAAEQNENISGNQITNNLVDAGNAANLFGIKLKGLSSGTIVFNLLSAGLEKVTNLFAEGLHQAKEYFKTALLANNKFSKSVTKLRSSLKAAAQPIYELLLPYATALVNWLDKAAKAAGRLLSSLTGRNYKIMQRNADKLNASIRSFDQAGASAGQFGSRLRSIAAGAFVFNVISSGLRSVTSYFGSALMANNQFAYAANRLRGSLMVAFQPIYESVLPALVQLINWLNVAVQAVARFFAILAGKSYKDMQNNASDLSSTIGGIGSSSGNAGEGVGNLGDAIEDTGEKAKEAEKYLAGFDEINRMLAEDAYDFGSGGSAPGFDPGEFNAPIFDEVEIPDEWETAIEELAMRIKDIFFEWENLNEEIVAEKLLTALMMLAGGIIGFKLGGVKGALIGMTVGAALGVILSSLIFDGDGKLSKDELIKTLIAALAVIGGTALLFKTGFTPGTVIGVAAIAGLSLLLANVIFDKNGQVTGDEIGKSLTALLLGLSGAGIGFFVGGIPGALIGALVGLGISFKLFKPSIDVGRSEVSAEAVGDVISALFCSLSAATIGFRAGGVPGALIGAAIGLGISFVVKGLGDVEVYGSFTLKDILEKILDIILALGGAVAGFKLYKSMGGFGPIGAALGVAIGLGLSFIIKGLAGIELEGSIPVEEILNKIIDLLLIVGSAALGFKFFKVGGSGILGAALGLSIGLILSFTIPDVTFEGLEAVFDKLTGIVEESSQIVQETTDEQLVKPTEKKFSGLLGKLGEIAAQIKDTIVQNMRDAATGVDQEFVEPTETEIEEASANIQNSMEEAKDGIVLSMESAAKGTQLSFIEPLEQSSSELAHTMAMDSQITSDRVVSNWVDAARDTEVGFINPTRDNFANLSHSITNDFDTARQSIQSDWRGMPSWFQMSVTGPMTGYFNDLVAALVSGFNKTAQQVAAAIRDLMSMLNQVLSHANGVTSRVSRTTYNAAYNAGQQAATPALAYPTMDIPMLARGAVIPPNHKFLAVLGDQKSGTNVEAPLATIQEAVALAMSDMIPAMLAGFEAVVSEQRATREAVEAIELDGEVLNRAMTKFRRKMAMVHGQPYTG